MFFDNVLNKNITLYLFIFLKRNLLNENIGLKNPFYYMISPNDDDCDLTVNILNQGNWKIYIIICQQYLRKILHIFGKPFFIS